MRIKTYRLDGTVKREANGDVSLTLDEANKKPWGSDQSIEAKAQDIPNIAKELSDANDLQRTLAKGTLMKDQQEAKVFLELKYLED